MSVGFLPVVSGRSPENVICGGRVSEKKRQENYTWENQGDIFENCIQSRACRLFRGRKIVQVVYDKMSF